MRLGKTGIAAFALACGLLLLPGCAGDSGQSGETSGAKATETEQTTAADLRQEIQLSENYSYKLPEDAEEETDFEESLGFSNERQFMLNEGNVVVRSFVIRDEENAFPGLVEYLYEDCENAKIGYKDFFDTAIAVADDELQDENGDVVYRRAYFWPDGGDVLCSLSFTSYSKEEVAAAGEHVLGTVTYANADSMDEFGQYDWEIPPNAEDALTPSQEEIDQAIMQDIQQSMMEAQDDYYEGYLDYDTTLGKRGR